MGDTSSTSSLSTAVGFALLAGIVVLAASRVYFAATTTKRGGSSSSSSSSSSNKKKGSSVLSQSQRYKSSDKLATKYKDDDDEDEDEDSAILKGYKKTTDGRQTTYFNRELSVEDRQLLGSSAPKPLGVAASAVTPQPIASVGSPSPIVNSSSAIAGSAWNGAGTFEEQDISSWGRTRLTALLEGVSVQCGDGVTVAVTSCSDVSGDAVVAMTRGKKKYIYDLTANLRWELTSSGSHSSTSGSMRIREITAEKAYEFELSVEPSERGPKWAQLEINVKSTSKGLRPAVTAALDRFLEEMKAAH